MRPDERLVSIHKPQSYEADQYRLLCHFLNQAREATGLKVLGVTSPTAGDGKTTTAINLAATLAQSPGVRVLLMDLDLRRPTVALNLGLDPRPGLVGAVVDERMELSAAVKRTTHKLAVLPAGPPPANAYHVLESSRVGELIDQARESYDYVVVDTPPVLLVPDCRLMSQWVDGFLLLLAAHRTPRKLFGEALNVLDAAKVLGIVFNGDDHGLASVRNKYYRSYAERAYTGRRNWWRWWRRRTRAHLETWPYR
jgi:capsular exopolysaccharide synthesis family protein